MKFRLLLFAFILVTATVSAQNFYIKGLVADSSSKELLNKANVILTRLPDSTVKGYITEKNGAFIFEKLKAGKYMLAISYVGYNPFTKNIELKNRSLDLKKIYIVPGNVLGQEIDVIGKIPPVVQKSDTAEYNAEAFKTNKDASAEELVSKMPGITVQDGKYQARGEDIKRVLVDGRPFFGDDPASVLKNVPAEIVDKIQVFDQQSEQTQFTGFDDGNTNKALNIVTRLRVKEGIFGRLAGGYGDDERYKASGSINFFNGDRRISLLSQLNNTNEQNFSIEDLTGVMSGVGGGGGGRRGGGMGGRPGGGGPGGPGGPGGGGMGGGNIGNFMVSAKNGLTTTKAAGVNYSDKWTKNLELTGSYFFNYTNSDAEGFTNRQYVLSSLSNQTYSENSLSSSRNINHRFNMKLDYQIDSANSLTFRPVLTFQQNDGLSSVAGGTAAAGNMLNSTNNIFNSNLKALNSSAELMFRHKFETTGRTISASLNSGYKKNTGDNKLFSESIYYDKVISSDTLNQYADLLKDGYNGSANIVYTEPLGTNGLLQFNSRLSYSEDKSDQKTYNNLADYSTSLDTSLSNIYKKIYRIQSYGTGYRYQKGTLSFMAGINYNISQLENYQTFPQLVNMEKKFESWLPSFTLRYNISRDRNLNVEYRTNNNDPSVDQLQNVINNTNPLQLSSGNPSLKQDYSNTFSLRYSQIDFASMSSFFIMLRGSYTNNYIGNNTFIALSDTAIENISLNKGSQFTRPENFDGYFNVRSFAAFSIPASLIKSNVNFPINFGYTRTPGMLNGLLNYSKTLNYGLGLVVSSNFSELLDFTVSTNGTYNKVTNTRGMTGNDSYYNLNSRFKFFWQFWNGFFIQTDLNHQYDNGLSSSYNRNSLIWNMGIGKKILSNDQGEVRLSAFDLLNQNTNIQRNITDSYIEDTRSNVLGRYFLLTFSYRISQF